MEKVRKRVAVVMQRRTVANRWQSEAWEAMAVLPHFPAAARCVLVDRPDLTQILYPGFEIVLQRSEAEGYYHNASTPAPNVFVLWRLEDALAVPHYVTVSYDEASRWMDGGAQVDPVAMPAQMCAWLRAFVADNYRPEPKKRMRPSSFLPPKDRVA